MSCCLFPLNLKVFCSWPGGNCLFLRHYIVLEPPLPPLPLPLLDLTFNQNFKIEPRPSRKHLV